MLLWCLGPAEGSTGDGRFSN